MLKISITKIPYHSSQQYKNLHPILLRGRKNVVAFGAEKIIEPNLEFGLV